VRPLMRASSAHAVGTALLVALPAIASAQAAASQAPATAPAPPPPPSVKVGDPAPDFDLAWFAPVGDGKENPPKYEQKRVKLSDFKGKQNVVVAFFPAAFSPGCTNEMKQYQTNHGSFTAANTKVLGVSVDSTWSNRAFREQLGVEFPILSDWKRDAARQYGLLDENSGVARRATFVVDKAGVVRKVDVGREALDPSGVVGMCKTLETQ
jgi:peroxiredoxin